MPRPRYTWTLLALLLVAASSALVWRTMRPGPAPDAATAHHQHASASASDNRAPHIDTTPPPGPAPSGMVWVPGGTFWMGCDDCGMPDARPVHLVRVAGFWMDEAPVTNQAFERFVRETGYVTIAERPLDPEQFPGVPASKLIPGSAVFVPPASVRSLDNPDAVVAVRRRRELAASRRQRQHDQGPRAASRGARGLGRCGRVL